MTGFRTRHAPAIRRVERRLLLRGGLSLGAVSLLAGCDLSNDDSLIDRTLWAMLRFNDRVQAALFNPNRLAATFTPADITRPFKFNAYYPADKIRTVDPGAWKMEVGGLVDDDTPWTLPRLRALPQESQITRHICVEGWSQIGQWRGVPLHIFLKAVGADLRARYVGFDCFDDYSSSIDMASALHPQTILALDFEEQPLTPPGGPPLRLRIPTKLGFKNPKYISSLPLQVTIRAGIGRIRATIGSAGRRHRGRKAGGDVPSPLTPRRHLRRGPNGSWGLGGMASSPQPSFLPRRR